MIPRLPPHTPGMRIGLFGGTFNPPHAGHMLVAEIALRRLKLDRLWLLVTPGNPLKNTNGLPPLAQRMAAARALARDPRIVVTGLEADIGTRYTYDTVAWLTQRAPSLHFVWVMGADNLRQFSRWQRWADIAALVPIAAIDRPGSSLAALNAKAAQRFAGHRLAERDATSLALTRPPAFVFLHDRRIDLSSTELRARRRR
ncbi:MAG TPA: nicotinate-nucleotide adenylyltransferase [Rhodoblastus sp.]|nr:nicotinate-nucleotide adenylyltransferase [Rhodoblastus sp.]